MSSSHTVRAYTVECGGLQVPCETLTAALSTAYKTSEREQGRPAYVLENDRQVASFQVPT